jgi:hypothetical protein
MGGGAEGGREESGLMSCALESSSGYRAAFTGEALFIIPERVTNSVMAQAPH